MIRTPVALFLLLTSLANLAAADMVIFHNGERRFGAATILSSSDVLLETNGVSKIYLARQVREVLFGVNREDIQPATPVAPVPAPADLDDATETYMPFVSSGDIFDVTGVNIYRKKLTTAEGRDFIVDVEEYFDIPIIQVLPMSYGFFARRGTFLRAIIYNREDILWNPVSFRIFLFDQEDRLLSTKDIYVRRLPATREIPQRRLVTADFPDTPYERVYRLRFARKF